MSIRDMRCFGTACIILVTNRSDCASMAALPLQYTSGFSPGALMDHLQKHGARLRIVDKNEYEQRADALFAIPKPDSVLECSRPDGDVIRLNKKTDEYGVIAADRVIRTYYIPIPCHKLNPANRRPGNCHHETTNLDYFRRNCRRRYAIY